jgi:hypothetical protein
MASGKGDKASKRSSLEGALRAFKARKQASAANAARDGKDLAAEIRKQEPLRAQLAALSQAERREVLDAAGLQQVSAAPRPLEPIRGGYVPAPGVKPARWHVWALKPRCELWEAVALSLDIEPEPRLLDDVRRGASPDFRLSRFAKPVL